MAGEGDNEPPHEVSEYHYEPPLWLEAAFSPWFMGGIGAPLIVVAAYVIWELVKG